MANRLIEYGLAASACPADPEVPASLAADPTGLRGMLIAASLACAAAASAGGWAAFQSLRAAQGRPRPDPGVSGPRADGVLATTGVIVTWLFLGAILSRAFVLMLGAPLC